MAVAAVVAVVGGILQATSAAGEADAIEDQSEFEQNRLAFNRKLANINAEDAIDRGEEQVGDFKQEAARLKGSQRAALAAQGIDVDSGSAAGIQYETEKQIDTDISRIRNNAWREAWGFKVESTSLQQQETLTGLAGRNAAQSTRVAGAVQGATTVFSAFSGGS